MKNWMLVRIRVKRLENYCANTGSSDSLDLRYGVMESPRKPTCGGLSRTTEGKGRRKEAICRAGEWEWTLRLMSHQVSTTISNSFILSRTANAR